MKTTIKKRLVFYWFLITEWFKSLVALETALPTPRIDLENKHDNENNMSKRSTGVNIKKFSSPKEEPTSPMIEQVIQKETNPIEDVIADSPAPTPEPVINPSQTKFSDNFKPHAQSMELLWTAPFHVSNLWRMHVDLDTRLGWLSDVFEFKTSTAQRLNLKSSNIIHNGEFGNSEIDRLTTDIITGLYEELYIKAEQINNLPSEYNNASKKLVMRPLVADDKNKSLTKITEVWSGYIDNDTVFLCHSLSTNIEMFCSIATPIIVSYSGSLVSFIQEIYNPINPQIVYGSYFEVEQPSLSWKRYI